MTGSELAAALAALGVDTTGWQVVSKMPDVPEGSTRKVWPYAALKLGRLIIEPGGTRKYQNFAKPLDTGSMLFVEDGIVLYGVSSLEELAGKLIELQAEDRAEAPAAGASR